MPHSLRHMLHRERHAIILSACLTAAVFIGLCSPEPSQAQHGHHVTPVIYAAQARAIIFSHAAHQDTSCATCHGSVGASDSASQTHSPDMEACATCHATKQISPKLEACSSCHLHYAPEIAGAVTKREDWQAVSPPPLIPGRTQAALTFSHRAHADSPCSTCHDTSGSAASMPSMASCTSCHDGTKAPDACATCHTRDHVASFAPEPTTRAPAPPSMLTSRQPADSPESHAHDWLERHGVIALAQSDDCMSCHTEASCASCHNARAGQPLAAHPPNYLIEHRLSARLAEQNCTDCHRQEASCQACHTRMLAAPTSASSPGPPPAIDFHAPGWLDASSANNHGVMARRHINECASCHQERDCISCHQGISPHPPEFALDCSRILQKNPISCTKCHTGSADTLCPTM